MNTASFARTWKKIWNRRPTRKVKSQSWSGSAAVECLERRDLPAIVSPIPVDNDDQTSEAIALGEMNSTKSKTGTISNKYDVDMYSFSAQAGQVIQIQISRTSSSTLNPRIQIFDLNQSWVYNVGAGNSSVRFTAPSSGTFYVGVSSNVNTFYHPVWGDHDFGGSNASGQTGGYLLKLTPQTTPTTPVTPTDYVISATDREGNGANNGLRDNFVLTQNGGNVVVTINGVVSRTIPANSIRSLTINGSTDVDMIDASQLQGISIKANGGDGNDILLGGGGNDTLDGGAGYDRLEGGIGNDSLYGGSGGAHFLAGAGDDQLFVNLTGAPSLEINGGAGSDSVWISGSNNVELHDTLFFVNGDFGPTMEGIERAKLFGTTGNDNLSSYFSGQVTVYGGTGNDTLTGDGGTCELRGEAGHDVLRGGGGNEGLFGDEGNDLLIPKEGNDVVDGGFGNDTVVATGDVDFTLSDSLLTGLGNDRLTSIENASLWAWQRDHRIDASAFSGSTSLSGGAGNDVILGGMGNDLIDGGAGGDDLTANGGNDTLRGGEGFDVLIEEANRDFQLSNTRLTGLGTDTLDSIEGVILTGGVGNNRLDASQFVGRVILKGMDGNDTLLGASDGDLLVGGNGNDVISGGGGHDLLSGDAGNDSLVGDAGDDWLYGGSGQDSLSDSSGQNRVDQDSVIDALMANYSDSVSRFLL